MLKRLVWLARRLAVMGPAELIHRFAEVARVRRLRGLQAAYRGREDLPHRHAFCTSAERVLPALTWSPPSVPAGELLAGAWPALGFPWCWGPDPRVWHVSPDTGRAWPQIFFGGIDYRQGNPIGDVRVLWEPARLQHLVALARLAELQPGRAAEAAARIQQVFRSWLQANPPYQGVHYLSAMECALRLIAVLHASDGVRAHCEPSHWGRVLHLVHSHASLIEKRLSLHSSLGNHTVAEAAGLVYAGSLFPEFPEAGGWRRRGLELLTREAGRQVLSDGGGIEQAFWYHAFVLDLLGLVDALLAKRGELTPTAMRRALDAGQGFLALLAPAPDCLPRVGDGDGGYALSPDLRISWDPEAPVAGRHRLAASGYAVVNGGRGRQLVFDHGPLGMPPSYGHGHADALAVTLYERGVGLLADPGTFTYNGAPEWRAYFRSTAAHNTVTIGNRDQADQASPFMWSRPYRAGLLACTEEDDVWRLLAGHDGYRPILHRRGVSVRGDGAVLVWDQLSGDGRPVLDLHWHSEAEWREDREGYLSLPDGSWRLRVDGGRLSRYRGSESPRLGWGSAHYGQKTPITTFRCRHHGSLPHEFLTLLTPAAAPWTSAEVVREVSAFKAALAGMRPDGGAPAGAG